VETVFCLQTVTLYFKAGMKREVAQERSNTVQSCATTLVKSKRIRNGTLNSKVSQSISFMQSIGLFEADTKLYRVELNRLYCNHTTIRHAFDVR